MEIRGSAISYSSYKKKKSDKFEKSIIEFDSLLQTQEKKPRIVSGSTGVSEAKEVQNATICWQGDGHNILER
jgi:hypothetical protein